VVYAIQLLRDMLRIGQNDVAGKNLILSQMQLLASVSSAGNKIKGFEEGGFVTYGKKYNVPAKYLAKVDDLYTEGYKKAVKRTIRAVGFITLTKVKSVCQSIYLVLDNDTLRAILDASEKEDRVIEIHHMLRGDQGVAYQHKVGGNARSVVLKSGPVPTFDRVTKN